MTFTIYRMFDTYVTPCETCNATFDYETYEPSCPYFDPIVGCMLNDFSIDWVKLNLQ
jgi:hypothetical protein